MTEELQQEEAALVEEVNALALSDEDIMNMPEPTDSPELNADQEEVATPDDGQENDAGTVEAANGEGEAPEVEPEHEAAQADIDPEGQEQEPTEEPLVVEDKPSKKGKSKKADEVIKEEEVSVKSSDDLLKELFTPFKANGKDMQVASIDDARTLMQMGANYNKKMAGLKPNLKLMKMLGNNDLLDEAKLSYLIDLSNKNPEAVQKLIKDSGIDPLEIDTEKTTEYKPGTYTVHDKEVELDQVLLDIEGTPTFQETIDIISNKWDDSSKKELLEKPSLIANINDQVANGIYEQIYSIVEQERTVGRLTELSDLEAYKHVGDVLEAQGVFNQPQAQQLAPIPAQAQAKEDPKLKAKKLAASGTKATPNKGKANGAINPLELSDEDFMRDAAAI
ncbi:MAG: hypothetical protein DRH90_24985 [Deltaproteobacteria bacterium]|nr:MAG: hypothetical protein DRH90_24985 [Deltaproteobacteria bacterium]